MLMAAIDRNGTGGRQQAGGDEDACIKLILCGLIRPRHCPMTFITLRHQFFKIVHE
jgi:hypothetical protein